VTIDMENGQDRAVRNQMLWFAGAVGTAVGIAVWAYSRKEPTYWEKTRRAAGDLAERASEINPWVGAGAGATALGGAALAYKLRQPKSRWNRAGERAGDFVSETGKQMRPGLGAIAAASLSVASALASAKARKRTGDRIAEGTSNAADNVAEVGSRIWQRLQTISEEGAKLYPHLKKMMA